MTKILIILSKLKSTIFILSNKNYSLYQFEYVNNIFNCCLQINQVQSLIIQLNCFSLFVLKLVFQQYFNHYIIA